jgi:hypothetical protein
MPKIIPRRDVDFHSFQEVVLKATDAEKVRWELDLVWLSAVVQPARDRWNTAWSSYLDPATRCPLLTFEKNEARGILEKLLRLLVRNLQSNTRVTEDERCATGIALRQGKRQPLPPPAVRPELDIRTPLPRRLAVRFIAEGSTHRARPHGTNGAIFRWALRNTPPAELEELGNVCFATRSPLMLDFKEGQRGSRIYFCAAWQSSTGATGPWSNVESAVIP